VTPETVRITVNGEAHVLPVFKQTSLLQVLRNDLELNSPKYGCGLGECGACTVLVDGVAARSCVIPANGVQGRHITTLEGLGSPKCLHPVQQAFIDEQAAQCGYCLNGMIMMTTALLARSPDPSEDEIRRELSGNLCRCGAHVEIMKAVRRAAQLTMQTPSGVSE
jgi:nicotinate dehydrogenase subunit A